MPPESDESIYHVRNLRHALYLSVLFAQSLVMFLYYYSLFLNDTVFKPLFSWLIKQLLPPTPLDLPGEIQVETPSVPSEDSPQLTKCIREASEQRELREAQLEFVRLNANTCKSSTMLKKLLNDLFEDFCRLLFKNFILKLLNNRLYNVFLINCFLVNVVVFLMRKILSLSRFDSPRNIEKRIQLQRFEVGFLVFESVVFNLHIILYVVFVLEFLATKCLTSSQLIQLFQESERLCNLGLACDVLFSNANEKLRCFVALSNKQLVGILVIRIHRGASSYDRRAELSSVYIAEKYRNLSIGRHLISTGLFYCKINSIEDLFTSISFVFHNQALVRLLETLNFRRLNQVASDFTTTYRSSHPVAQALKYALDTMRMLVTGNSADLSTFYINLKDFD